MNEQEYVDVPQEYYNQSYPMPIPQQRSDKADLMDKINPDAIVEEIRHKLMGEQLIDGVYKKATFLSKDGKIINVRAISELGAWDIANLMLSVSSRNVSISKLTDAEIRERTMGIIKTAQYMLNKNWKAYGITGIDQLHFIHQIILSNSFITLKQPESEGIRKLLGTTINESYNRNVLEEKKKGFLSGILRRG